MNLLEDARKIINDVDSEMAELFVKRMKAVEMVAEHKKQHGLPVLDEAREAAVIQKGSERVQDDTLREYYVDFIKNNMKISRDYQYRLLESMKVAYSGTEGAFAHIATKKLFPNATYIAYPSFNAAYESVESGECDAAVLPVENSRNGEVGAVTDLMFSGNLFVNSMLDLAVSQDLLVLPGTQKSEIKKVISHQQALGQCAEYIRANGWKTEEYPNTALAAKLVSEMQDRSVAAIASAEASDIFGLEVLEKNINESRSNTTRFAAFTRARSTDRTKKMGDHFILLFTVKNEAGALARAIDVIGRCGFNMRTLRSRPMKELLWQYYFYVEAEGNVNATAGRIMMEELSMFCDRLKLVGSYTKEV